MRLNSLLLSAAAVAAAPGWEFIQAGTTGILALEAIVVSPNLVLFFDRPQDDPLQIDGHSAWGALWNIQKNFSTPLRVTTNSFCASGALLSNGTMVSLGGNPTGLFPADGDQDGRQSIRIFEPCLDPDGVGCELFENVTTHHMAEPRWYPTAIKIFDGSLMIIGGIGINTPFYNTLPINSFEFFPKKDGGVPRNSSFLERSLPANLFPRAFQLPDGQIFMVANNQTILYDLETQVETILPDIPNGVRVTNPFDGTAALLPLVPPLYTPEVLVCGGTNITDDTPPAEIDVETPASNQCSRIKLTPDGIKAGWQIEHMLEGRMMPEMILMPNGQILILNGAQTGTAALASIKNPIGNSNSDNPALTPSLYTPNAPLGQRISNKGLPTTSIARVYHSAVTMIPDGRILIAGSNPNPNVTLGVKFPTEFRLEYLNPPFISMVRPKFTGTLKQLRFGQTVTVPISIPQGLNTNDIKVSLIDLGFSSHAWHSSSRLVFLEHTISRNRDSITFTGPPNGKIFPPGPGVVFLTVNDVTSEGLNVMIGSGRSPPTLF